MKSAQQVSLTLVVLIVFCAVWETIGAPIRAGGSWLALKGLILLPFVWKTWHGERRAFQILSLLILAYLLEGIMRAYADTLPMQRAFAWGEIVLSTLVFILTLRHLRIENRQHAQPSTEKPARKKITGSQYIIALCVIWGAIGFTTDGYLALKLVLFLPLIVSFILTEKAALFITCPIILTISAAILWSAPADPLLHETPYAWSALILSLIGVYLSVRRAQSRNAS